MNAKNCKFTKVLWRFFMSISKKLFLISLMVTGSFYADSDESEKKKIKIDNE